MYNVDDKKRKILMEEYEYIIQRLDKLEQSGEIDELEKQCIIISMREVLRLIAKKYQKIVKEGEKVMGGELLEYPAKTSYREGREEGVRDMIAKMFRGGMEPNKIAEICDIPLSLVKDVKDGMSISKA